MTGQIQWAWCGAIPAIIGLVILLFTFRRKLATLAFSWKLETETCAPFIAALCDELVVGATARSIAMLFLVLGKGKTGSLVAEVARERSHGVRTLEIHENRGASALTAPTLAGVDVVIDFTNADSAVENMRAVLALGAASSSAPPAGTPSWTR